MNTNKKDAFELTVGQALGNPEIKAVFKRNTPALLSHPLIGLAKGYKLKDLVAHSKSMNISKEKIETIRLEINQIINK